MTPDALIQFLNCALKLITLHVNKLLSLSNDHLTALKHLVLKLCGLPSDGFFRLRLICYINRVPIVIHLQITL